MEQDTFLLFPIHDSFPLFDQNLFFCPSTAANTNFSPRDFTGCSPRTFFAQPGSTLSSLPSSNNLPDSVEWDSTGSVGSRRSSDEFSEASAKPSAEWRKALEDSARMMKTESFGRLPIPLPLGAPPAPTMPKLFPCKEPGCTKTYTTTEGLRLHNRNIHMKDKRHRCTVDGCERAFVRASDLKLHILRIHEKERPFPCSEPNCNKSFACNSELTRHLNCHNRNRSARKKQRRSAQDDEE